MFLPGAANVMALVRSVQLAFAMVAWSSVWAEEKTRWRQIHVQMNECIYNIYDTCVMDMLLKRYAGSISAVYEVPMIYKAYVRCILYTSIYYIYIQYTTPTKLGGNVG